MHLFKLLLAYYPFCTLSNGQTLIKHFWSILKAEQLRQQFSRAESERNELTRKLEESHGKLEENESARKRLQGRLDSLSRQMEEGQGDRERLVEQLETLRGQVRGSLYWTFWNP